MATYAEIQQQIKELTAQAEAAKRAERAEGIAEIRELMASHGISLEDLQGSATKTRKSSGAVAAKYKDPVSGKTWSGRGRTPTWITDAEANGSSRDNFLI